MTTKVKGRTSKTSKPKAGSIRIASPKELQARAVAALSKMPKGAQITAEKAAAILAATCGEIFTLEDIALGIEGNPTDTYAIFASVKAISAGIRGRCGEAFSMLPNGHAADRSIAGAIDALRSLERFADVADQSSDATLAKRKSDFGRMVAEVITSYAGTAGRYVEQAQIALGVEPDGGFLRGACLAGSDGMTYRPAPTIQTEKDGRLYALALLAKVEKEMKPGEFSNYSAQSEKVDAGDGALMMIFRDGPQYAGLREGFDYLYEHASPAAISGFFAVFTEYFGNATAGAGVMDIDAMQRMEKRGEFEPWGTVNYSDPQAAVLALAKGESAYRIKANAK